MTIADGIMVTALIVLVVGIVLGIMLMDTARAWVAYSLIGLGIVGVIAAIWVQVLSPGV